MELTKWYFEVRSHKMKWAMHFETPTKIQRFDKSHKTKHLLSACLIDRDWKQ